MSKFLVFFIRRLNAVTFAKEKKLAINDNYWSSCPEKLFTTAYRETMWEHARVPMPEMETQREWTSLQLLESPLGSVPGLVTSATHRPWFRYRFRSQESCPYRWRSSSKFSPISPTRTFTPSVTCPCFSTGSHMIHFYGELTRYIYIYIYMYQYRLESSTDLRRKEEEKDYMLKIFIIHSNLCTYSQVTNNEQDTAEVIKELKRMPLLKKFSISVRADCDEILRQISLTNKKLEELHVSNCTGFIFSLSHRQLLSFFPSLSFN